MGCVTHTTQRLRRRVNTAHAAHEVEIVVLCAEMTVSAVRRFLQILVGDGDAEDLGYHVGFGTRVSKAAPQSR